jgi:predicted permease
MGTGGVAGASSRWPRRLMVGAEVALSVVLLVGAGLLVKTFERLTAQPPGFDSRHVISATLSLQDARYTTSEKVNRLFDRTIEGMRAIPGVESAAVCLTLPYERALNLSGRWVGGSTIPVVNVTYVTPGYFDTLRVPLERGRLLTDADNASAAPAIVVNHAFVQRLSRDQDPIGRQVVLGGFARTIVGIVGDVQQKAGWGSFGPLGAIPGGYVPAAQVSDGPDGFFKTVHTWFSPSWIVRTAGGPAIAADMQRVVQRVDPQLPFAKFRTLDEVRGEALAGQRARATLLGSLAIVALLLASVGIYGLVASSVAERTRELGIRIALGATPSQTLKVAVMPGVILGAIGVGVGLAAARAASRVLQSLVWNVSVGDPATFISAAIAVLAVAALATVAPSLRILRLNPVRALRDA